MAKKTTRKTRCYPSDVSDEEWEFCVPYLTLMSEEAPAAGARAARDLQRVALDDPSRLSVALAAARSAAVDGGASADAALDPRGMF